MKPRQLPQESDFLLPCFPAGVPDAEGFFCVPDLADDLEVLEVLAPSDELLPKLAARLAGSPPTPPATSAAAVPAAADDAELAGCASSAQAQQLPSFNREPKMAAVHGGEELLEREAAGHGSIDGGVVQATLAESGQPDGQPCQPADAQMLRAAVSDAHAAQASTSAPQQQPLDSSAVVSHASCGGATAQPERVVSAPAACYSTVQPSAPCTAEPQQLAADSECAAVESEEGFHSPKTGKVIPIGG
jgi:hypothetical protein